MCVCVCIIYYIYTGTYVDFVHHLMANKTSKLVAVMVSACVKGGAVATGSAVPLHGRGVPQRRFGSLNATHPICVQSRQNNQNNAKMKIDSTNHPGAQPHSFCQTWKWGLGQVRLPEVEERARSKRFKLAKLFRRDVQNFANLFQSPQYTPWVHNKGKWSAKAKKWIQTWPLQPEGQAPLGPDNFLIIQYRKDILVFNFGVIMWQPWESESFETCRHKTRTLGPALRKERKLKRSQL